MTKMKQCSAKLLAIIGLCVAAMAASAAGGGGGGGGGANADDATPTDPVIATARAAIARKDWAAAQAGLKQALAANPNQADYHNLYAYSVRKGPNPDMALVFTHYGEALRIDPKHRAAHEYSGEAYLQVDDVAKAKEHLAALDKLCRFGCEEYSDLKKAVAQYEASRKR
jgi:tetratricopeptide (TPR) repeat protein